MSPNSRWSCTYDLKDTPCQLRYGFDEPQDIVELQVSRQRIQNKR